MTNITIVLAFITMIVAGGLLALSPSMMGNVQAEKYEDEYGYDNDYYKDDNKYSYDKKDKKSPHIDIQKIDCGNSNVNINGVDVTQIPQDNTAVEAANEGGTGAANTESSNGILDRINFERNLVNVCANANDNGQTSVNTEEPPEIPLFTCDAESNLGADAIVTDEQLCNAATPAEQCPEGTDLEGVWVVDADAEGACDVESGGAVTAVTYENAGTPDTSSPLSSTATCNMGDVVTGGGFALAGNSEIISSKKTTGEGWVATGTGTGMGLSLTAFVTCLTNPLSP